MTKYSVVGILFLSVLVFSSNSITVQSSDLSNYNFKLKQGDSVSYKISSSDFSFGTMSSHGNSTSVYQINVSIPMVNQSDIEIRIDEIHKDNPQNYTFFVSNESVLYLDPYSYIFNGFLNSYLQFNNSAGFNLIVLDLNKFIYLNQNQSWVCNSCSMAYKQENNSYLYDKMSGWLVNGTYSYSETYYSNGSVSSYYFTQINTTTLEWKVKTLSNLYFFNISYFLIPFIALVIINKRFQRKI